MDADAVEVVRIPCPICQELFREPDQKVILWNRGGAFIYMGICPKCHKVLLEDAKREIRYSKMGEAVQLRRGKMKL